MPTKGWGKGTEVLNAVQDVMIRRLTTAESLVFLESRGFKMSEAKLRRIKRHIRESTNDRLDYIAYHEYAASHIDAIDTVKSVNSRLWEIVAERSGTKDELRALELIPNNVKILEELYDSNPVISSIHKKIQEAKDVS